MPIIRHSVQRTRGAFQCDMCHGMVEKGERYTRLFGYAYRGDKPHEMRLCSTCQHPDYGGYENLRKEGLPVQIGLRVSVDGRIGVIRYPGRLYDLRLHVRFNDGRRVEEIDPRAGVTYLADDGTVLWQESSVTEVVTA